MKKTLYFVTGNRHKLLEVSKMLGPDFRIRQLAPKEPEIRSDSLEEIARHKVLSAPRRNGPVMADDSGLFVRALFGFPGACSAYVHEKLGCEGLLKLMAGVKDRRAEFRSAIALLAPNGKVRVFTGAVIGKIANRKLGRGGFAFDPIFIPAGRGKSFGQMEMEEKNSISHRGRAFRKLASFLPCRPALQKPPL